MRTLVLVDGEHYPPVVRAALDLLSNRIPGCRVVGAALLGGTEKLPEGLPDLDVPLVTGESPDDALVRALHRWRPVLVVDLSDEPVVDNRSRMLLAARAMAAGAAYEGADFRFDPPPRPRLVDKPSIAVVGTGKRTGKTAVSAHLARTLVASGRRPIIVAMSRGGPVEPELVDPTVMSLTVHDLLRLSDAGRHAASDHLEDALMARVATIGTRRCGGGMAGAPFDSTFHAGVAIANERHEDLVVLEGSGRAMPPVHADATVCVVPASADPDLVVGHVGAYRLLLSDAVVITMVPATTARSGDEVAKAPQASSGLERSIRGLVPGIPILRTTFRPRPLAPIAGRRIAFATTAPPSVSTVLKEHLEREHDCTVIGVSHQLGNRPRLRADLEEMREADCLLVELKAAAIDLAARFATERQMDVVFCDNQVVSVGGDGHFEEAGIALAQLAESRHSSAEQP